MEWVEKEKLRPGQTGVLKIYENAKAQEGKRERERGHIQNRDFGKSHQTRLTG